MLTVLTPTTYQPEPTHTIVLTHILLYTATLTQDVSRVMSGERRGEEKAQPNLIIPVNRKLSSNTRTQNAENNNEQSTALQQQLSIIMCAQNGNEMPFISLSVWVEM